MDLQFILLIAVGVTFLGGGFAILFSMLTARLEAGDCSPDWLENFSLESYAPMERLLERSDIDFLASQDGYRPQIGRRLMAERRRIFAAYLTELVRDFNQLVKIGKLMIVYSAQDPREFANRLWRQQVRFYAEVCSVRLQLALYPLGWNVVDAHRLVAALGVARNRVQLLASPQQQFEIA